MSLLATLTPSQTIGPFLHIEVPYGGEEHLVEPNHRAPIPILGRSTTATATQYNTPTYT